MRDVSTTGRYVPFSILKYGDTVYFKIWRHGIQ